MLTKVYAPGDAATTAANVLANASLVRGGVVADLLQATLSVFVGMTLYRLLKDVSQHAASAMVVLIAIASAIMCLNDLFQFAAVLVATDGTYVTAFGTAGANALVLLLLNLQHYGFLIAQIFFGLWLLPMGYLVYRSGMFPKALGVMLVAGGVCYLVDMLTTFLLPDLGKQVHGLLAVPPTIAEVWMVGYLLVRGVRVPARNIPAASAGMTSPLLSEALR